MDEKILYELEEVVLGIAQAVVTLLSVNGAEPEWPVLGDAGVLDLLDEVGRIWRARWLRGQRERVLRY